MVREWGRVCVGVVSDVACTVGSPPSALSEAWLVGRCVLQGQQERPPPYLWPRAPLSHRSSCSVACGMGVGGRGVRYVYMPGGMPGGGVHLIGMNRSFLVCIHAPPSAFSERSA